MHPSIEKIFNWPLYQRLLLLAGVVALIFAGFVYLVYLEKHKEYVRLEQQKEARLAKLQEDRRIANNLPKFKSEYESMKRKLDHALAELPNKQEIPTLLTNIASLAKDNGLDVLRFKPDNEIPQGFYAEVPVSLKLVGSYHEVAMFTYDVSNMARIVNINNLKMDSPKMSGGRNLLSIECLATTFRFVEGGTAPNDKNKRKNRKKR